MLQEYLTILYLSQRLTISTICASTFNNTTSKVLWVTGTHMAVPERSLDALKEGGIDKPEDILEFLKDYLDSVFESLRKPPLKVLNNKVVAVSPHVMLEKSRRRIVVAAEAMRYYAQVGRDITPTNIHWKTLTNIGIQWNVLNGLKKYDDNKVPKLANNGRII